MDVPDVLVARMALEEEGKSDGGGDVAVCPGACATIGDTQDRGRGTRARKRGKNGM